MSKPKLQVVCLTYNHEKYIRQALDGFVMQKTNFPFEVLIGDDASTDNTPKIIREYAKKYPNIIKPVLRKKNIGAQANSFDLLQMVNAQYLALCEGDDYWTDENKLQIQVDFLDAHPDCNGCWHNAEIKKEPDIKEWNTDFYFPADKHGHQYWPNSIRGFNKLKPRFKLTDILNGPIATASIVYRYPENMTYPKWFKTAIAGDRSLHSLIIKDGYFKYIDKTMSVYRVSRTGVWFNKNNKQNAVEELKKWLGLISNIHNTLGKKYDKTFKEYTTCLLRAKLNEARNENDIKLAKYILKQDSDLGLDYIFAPYDVCTRVYNRKIFKRAWVKAFSTSDRCKVYLFGIRLFKLKRTNDKV